MPTRITKTPNQMDIKYYESFDIYDPHLYVQKVHKLHTILPINCTVKVKLINNKLNMIITYDASSNPIRKISLSDKDIYCHDPISNHWLDTDIKLSNDTPNSLLGYDITGSDIYGFNQLTSNENTGFIDVTERLFKIAKNQIKPSREYLIEQCGEHND